MKYRNETKAQITKNGIAFKAGEERDLTSDEVRKLGTPLPEGLVLVQTPKILDKIAGVFKKDAQPEPVAEKPAPVPAAPNPVVVPNALGQAVAFRR